jgi:hypothetical protein
MILAWVPFSHGLVFIFVSFSLLALVISHTSLWIPWTDDWSVYDHFKNERPFVTPRIKPIASQTQGPIHKLPSIMGFRTSVDIILPWIRSPYLWGFSLSCCCLACSLSTFQVPWQSLSVLVSSRDFKYQSAECWLLFPWPPWTGHVCVWWGGVTVHHFFVSWTHHGNQK